MACRVLVGLAPTSQAVTEAFKDADMNLDGEVGPHPEMATILDEFCAGHLPIAAKLIDNVDLGVAAHSHPAIRLLHQVPVRFPFEPNHLLARQILSGETNRLLPVSEMARLCHHSSTIVLLPVSEMARLCHHCSIMVWMPREAQHCNYNDAGPEGDPEVEGQSIAIYSGFANALLER